VKQCCGILFGYQSIVSNAHGGESARLHAALSGGENDTAAVWHCSNVAAA